MKSLLQRGIAALGICALAVIFVPSTASAANYSWSGAWTTPVYATAGSWGGYQNQYQYLQSLIQLLERLQEQLRQLQDEDFDDDDDSDDDAEIEVTTLSATDIDGDEARLRGEIDFNDSDEAYVWFEWGEDEDDLDEETPRIFWEEDDDEEFSSRITDLDDDEEYFFRAVGEDEDGNIDKGKIKSFDADENDDDDDNETPDVETDDADNVTDDEAEIGGDVDMNDFKNGIVFFVWGEDEDQVSDVEDDYDTYDEVDEDGDDLQKLLADSDLDGSASYTAELSGLDDDTEYFFNICVEYEDEDDDDTILCGSVESFTTED